MCYNVTVGKTFGIGASVRYWRARIGLAIGSAAAAVLLCTSYSYILHIEISGNESVPTATIERVLSDNGITFGVKKKCIDLSEAAAAAGNTPGISDASCEIKGTTLYVRVLESPDETEVKRFPSMVSAYDAKVTRIVVRNGTSLVKRGDVVKVGDFVADGRVYSTAGELLYTGDCDADVYGNVSLVFTKILGTTSVEYRETGKAEKKTGFKLFGFDIFDTSSSFVSYESRAATANYDVLLPLYVTTIYYRETEAVTTERNIDDVAMEYMKRVAEDMSFAGDFQSSYTVKPAESGLYSVSVFLSGETLISRGSEKPLQIENEPADV